MMIPNTYPLRYAVLLALVGFTLGSTACHKERLQTVETGELLYPEQDPQYKFNRNQESSVDLQEPELIATTLQDLHRRYLDEAYIRDASQLSQALKLLGEGLYGYAPSAYIATSPLHSATSTDIKQDLTSLIDATARISGLGTANPTLHRRQEAEEGKTGQISSGDASSKSSFVDERGLVVSSAYRLSMLGAINLDKVLNEHLDESIISNEALINQHENQVFLAGTNYTALEHHWDLAYGYYLSGLRPLAVAGNVTALRGALRQLDLAFTLGRIDINYHLYDELPKHVATIRRELRRVFLLRLENLLVGGNTLANLREDPRFAFAFLSEAYGYIYALQFLRSDAGKPIYSRAEVLALQAELLGQRGLWDTARLLGTDSTRGVLYKLVDEIKARLRANDK